MLNSADAGEHLRVYVTARRHPRKKDGDLEHKRKLGGGSMLGYVETGADVEHHLKNVQSSPLNWDCQNYSPKFKFISRASSGDKLISSLTNRGG